MTVQFRRRMVSKSPAWRLQGSNVPLSITSGEIGGLINSRDQILGGFVDQLNSLASTFASEFNQLYSTGPGDEWIHKRNGHDVGRRSERSARRCRIARHAR